MYLKFAKTVDLKCSHCKKETVICWGDGGVNKYYSGRHFTIYQCIKLTYTLSLHNVIC